MEREGELPKVERCTLLATARIAPRCGSDLTLRRSPLTAEENKQLEEEITDDLLFAYTGV